MSSAHLYKTRFQTLFDRYTNSVQSLSSFDAQESQSPNPLQFRDEAFHFLSQLAAVKEDMIALLNELNQAITDNANKAKATAMKATQVQKSNKELEEDQDSEKDRDETAKGLYEEERNLYNLNLIETGLYVSAIVLMLYQLR